MHHTRRATLAATLVSLCVLALPATAAAGDAIDAGDVVVVSPDDGRTPLNEGDSTTAFTFRLPDDARCGGDSMHDGWRVHTFLVPETADLSSMEYDANHPIGDGNLPMRDVNGRLVVHTMTDVNDAPGQEAPINPIPVLTFAHWEPQYFPPGTYKVGVACAPASRVVERYWDAEIVVTEDVSVEPGQRRWVVADDFRPPSEFPTLRVMLIAIAIAASIAVAVITWRGRRADGMPTPPGPGRSSDRLEHESAIR